MTIQQHNPPQPGELIKRTYIDPFDDISSNQIAKRLGVAVSTFNRLINGVSDISPEMAIIGSPKCLAGHLKAGC